MVLSILVALIADTDDVAPVSWNGGALSETAPSCGVRSQPSRRAEAARQSPFACRSITDRLDIHLLPDEEHDKPSDREHAEEDEQAD